MTTVKQLIERLQELPENTQVSVLKEHIKAYDVYTSFTDLDLDELTGNFDYFNVDNDPVLYLGEN